MTLGTRFVWLFDTAIGRCGIAWGSGGVTRVGLPERDDDALLARMSGGEPNVSDCAPTADVALAVDGIAALMRGEPLDLAFVRLDLEGVPPFNQRVYDVARRIAPGRTSTYGAIARELGVPGSARAVGQALGKNPFPVVVPCHRVLAAGGKTGGFSASGGATTKLRMLRIEGALPEGTTLSLFDDAPARAR